MRLRPSYVTVAAADAAGALTAVVLVVPSVHFAYRSTSLHATLETAAGLVAALAAYLVLGRFRRSGRADDLILFGGLAVLAVSNFIFSATPWTLAGDTSLRFSTWMTLLGTFVGSALLAAAAFAPAVVVRRPRALAQTSIAIAGFFVCAGVAVALLHNWLPLG